MGILLTKLYEYFGSGPQRRILMLGLDSAGKTTIVNKLKSPNTINTIPTIGFNCEEVTMPEINVNFVIWDVGGQEKIRALWRHYYVNTSGLFYVVDSSDRDRLKEVREELFRVINDVEMIGVPVVILANKQDLPNAASLDDIAKELCLNSLSDRQWTIFKTIAVNGDGIYEAMKEMGVLSTQFFTKTSR